MPRAAQVLEREQVPAVGTEQAPGAAPCPSHGPGHSQALCLGSRNLAALQLGCRTYVTPKFPAGQSPSAPGSAAFQGFLFDLPHSSCVNDLDAASGGSWDPPSPSFYTSALIIGLNFRCLVEAVGWCKPMLRVTQVTPEPHTVPR